MHHHLSRSDFKMKSFVFKARRKKVEFIFEIIEKMPKSPMIFEEVEVEEEVEPKKRVISHENEQCLIS